MQLQQQQKRKASQIIGYRRLKQSTTRPCIVRFLECTLWDTSWHVQKILEKVVRKETGTLLQAANARLTKPAHAEVRFREWQLQAAL